MSDKKTEAEKLKQSGNEALKAGAPEQAVQLYSQAIACDAENAALFSNRSAAYCAAAKYMEAQTDAETAIKLKPNWAKGHSRKGAALQYMKRYEEAMQAYMESLQFDPKNETVKKSVEECKEMLSGPGGSQPIMNPFADPLLFAKLEANPKTKLLMKDPSFRETMSKLQKDPRQLGQVLQDKRVLTALTALIGGEIMEEMPEEDGDKADSTSESKKEPEKEEQTESMETDEDSNKVDPETKKMALAEKEMGNAAYKKKDFETALEHYGKAIELDPMDITYRNNRAAVFFEQAKYDECIKECEEAVDVGRDNRADFQLIAKALARIGNTYRKKDDLEQCLKYLNKSLSEHRNSAVAKVIQEVKKEQIERERLAKINPERAVEEKEKGNEYFKNGDYPNALKYYSEAVACNPDDPKIYSNRAACYTKLARFDLALKDCDTCIRLDPKFIKGYLRKGNIHTAMKESDKAAGAYQKALDIDPNCQEALDGYRKSVMDDTKDPETVRQRAMANPEVQRILGDPAMQLILQQMQKDPKALQEHLKNPEIAKNIEKLMECGLISIR